MDSKLSSSRQWLINDQYEHGEFGKHEIINLTDLPRTFEKSLIKPNIFSSIIAYSTLKMTGEVPKETQKSFHKWLDDIRSESGYWTSASGSIIPFANSAGWARSNNLRHTAKCLDYYLLCEKFSYQDAEIFNSIIEHQLKDGSFPQFEGMDSDLWSTAYFVNLLVRAALPQNLKKTLPRGENESAWKNRLNIRLSRAVDWLMSKLDEDLMWHISGANPGDISIAMMFEIGGYLAIHKGDICAAIIHNLLETQSTSASLIFVACLAMDILPSEDQAIVMEKYDDIILNYTDSVDLIDATSLCKLLFLNKNIGTLIYYRNISDGHESLSVTEAEWNHSDYFHWALCEIYNDQYNASPIPLQEADFWQYINQSIYKVKNSIENNRLWELLWNDKKPVDERKVQVVLNNQFKLLCESDNVIISKGIGNRARTS